MRAGESLRVAVEALRVNRLRSALTMLGVVIGVSAVVVLVSIGAGAKGMIEEQISGLGTNIIFVFPGEASFGAAPTKSRLTMDDVAHVGRITGDPSRVTTAISSGEQARVGRVEIFTTLTGTTQNVSNVFDRPLRRGRYLSATDVDTRRRVAVLGSAVAAKLFGDIDPLGRQVAVAGVRFRVVGVYETVGSAFGISRDEEVHVPVTTAQRLLGVAGVDAVAVRATTPDEVEGLQRRVIAALKAKHPGEQFSALTQTQLLGTIGAVLGMLTGVLAAIASISLLVGGVGVSNIMLVSVRERTREIGLRKALGARQRDITRQFLIEAVLLTSVGGVVGILLGIAGSLTIEALSPVPAAITWWAPVLAFAVSAAVGVFFGVVPARRAGKLDPVTALRSE